MKIEQICHKTHSSLGKFGRQLPNSESLNQSEGEPQI